MPWYLKINFSKNLIKYCKKLYEKLIILLIKQICKFKKMKEIIFPTCFCEFIYNYNIEFNIFNLYILNNI